MATTKPGPFISPSINDAVQTNIEAKSPAMRDVEREREYRERWQELIDHKLIEWGRDPSQFDDEGVEPPSREIIRLAIALAEWFKAQGLPAPDSVVPDPNGGIVFERREGGVSEVFHVWDDGTIEYQRFHGTRLVERCAVRGHATDIF